MSLGGTTFSYGEFTLQMVRTLDYAQRGIREEDVDLQCIEHTIVVEGIFNPEATSYGIGPAQIQGVPPGETIANVEHYLAQPRRPLTFRNGAVDIVQNPEPGRSIGDVRGGPFIDQVRVKRIDGVKTMIVELRARTYTARCDGSVLDVTSPIISNRWTQSEEIDEVHKQHITTSGIATFRLDYTDIPIVVDRFRRDCVPKVPKGFRRVACTIRVSPRGDQIFYQIRDSQIHAHLGDTFGLNGTGVVKFSATYGQVAVNTVTGQGESTTIPLSTVHVFDGVAWGSNASRRDGLIVFLVAMMSRRLGLPAGLMDPETGPLLQAMSVRESIDEPRVELHAEFLRHPTEDQIQNIGPLIDEWLGWDPQDPRYLDLFAADGTNPQFPNDRGTRGPYPYLLRAQELADACEDVFEHGDAGVQAGASGDEHQGSSVVIDVRIGAPPALEQMASIRRPEWHVDYYVETALKRDQNAIACPVAGDGTQPQVVLRLANPSSIKTIRGTASRIGQSPVLPSPYLTLEPDHILLSDSVQPLGPALAADGNSLVHRASFEYRYALLNPLGAGDTIRLPLMPTYNQSYGSSVTTIGPTHWEDGLIG
jgi:hypothetical protein